MNIKACLIICVSLLSVNRLFSQSENENKPIQGQLHGNFQMLWQQYTEDSLIGAIVPAAKTGLNAFGNFTYTYGKFSAGVRFESYVDAIQGYSVGGRFKGTGIGHRFARYNNDGLDITVGNFYEQFGSGLSFRTYWEPNLGIDNAMDGARVIYTPFQGATVKAVYGYQRYAFDSRLINSESLLRGIDGEIHLNDLAGSLKKIRLKSDSATSRFSEAKTKVIIGGSFISKFQQGGNFVVDSLLLSYPENIGLAAGRISIIHGPFSIFAEYANKVNDPSKDNNYIYKTGEAIFVNASYSRKGLGINVAAKNVDNMSFRSERDATLFDLPVNFNPAITKQHTYNLAATLYPYATPIAGESSFMAEVFYNLPKNTKIGGKYGTLISLNFAAANSLDKKELTGSDAVVYGYERASYGFGNDKYVRDLNIEIKRKLNKKWSVAATYYYLEFNTLATPVSNDFKGLVYADIEVIEINYKLTPKNNFHLELQAMQTKQDKGDWGTALLEYTYSPHWNIAIIDQYNYGNSNADKRIHYLFGTVGYINGANRISLGYGKRREGVFCIGGVCRAVPATNGFEVSITSTF
jgi:hypothetical protein